MGALTSKNLPFELRQWDIEYFESIDPTDSFGSRTRVYVKENQIVQIEPNYNSYTHDLWITDKGRQFFDSIFNQSKIKAETYTQTWSSLLKKLILTIYYFDFFNYTQKKLKKLTLIFENLGLEVLSFLIVLKNNFSFLELKKIKKNNVLNDFESNFQLNLSVSKLKLNLSTFCLIVSNNPRYEGYYLNLYLKKRFSKGNFENFILGSLINLTFFTSFLNSTLKTFSNIIKGKHLICQKLKTKKKPILIINSNFFKRSDSTFYLKTLQILQQSNIISTNWNGINVLNYSLFENGVHSTAKYETLKLKNLFNFSSLFFFNVGANNLAMLKKIIKNKLLNFSNNSKYSKKSIHQFLIIDQSQLHHNKAIFFQKFFKTNEIKKQYYYMPCTTFYENEETFINTKGIFYKTVKLIAKKKVPWWCFPSENLKNNWQILKQITKLITEKIFFCSDTKNNNNILSNILLENHFINFINLNFYATTGLMNLNLYLQKQTESFIYLKYKFKTKTIKIYYTKLNYWLDDFFISGKDEFSYNSKVLNFCSSIFKKESTLFF